ncbi:MAG: CaiB/BaiF CoA transferase family protein [Candidatus Binatia bacterium]
MAPALPLEDVKILDFMWVMAGPAATRILADYGATIVRVESPTRIDTARTLHPRHRNEAHSDSSGLFGNCNAGKLGLSLDLGHPAAREVVFDLVRWADVVTESFSPKAMRKWGFDYQRLREVKPDIIMLSSCLMGQTGPLSTVAGFGTMGAAVAGFHELTGWPDRAPAGVFGAYTDYVSPRFIAVAILAALEVRRREGKGQYVDLSQVEASTHVLAPAVLDYTVNGRLHRRAGNTDARWAPHGVYPASGDDRWAAIVCRTDRDWRELCAVMNRPDLVADRRFATAAGRLGHRGELDRAIAEWSRGLEASEIERMLQARGIAAHEVQNSRECARDPQLRHRGHFVELPHPVYGTTVVEGPRARLSRTPATVRRAAPSLGRDNQLVLETILGYDESRISDLVVSGALG